jgi:hypothetical protein
MYRSIISLELKIQSLFEKNLVTLLTRHFDIQILALELARTLEYSLITPDQRKQGVAPHQYTLTIHPQTASDMKITVPDLQTHLSTQITEIIRSLGLILVALPQISIKEDISIDRRSVKITAETVDLSDSETRQMTPLATGQSDSATFNNAYIIVDGDYCHTLSKPMITIGRNLDNDIIIETPDISRSHAQIRLRINKWVLYDTSSSSGTRLNNQQVKEQILENGDVISIGSTTLIFVNTSGDLRTDTTNHNLDADTIPIKRPTSKQ